MSNTRLSREVERFLRDMVDEPGVNPEIGAWWVRRFVARRAWGQRLALYELDLSKPIGRRAIITFIHEVAAHQQLTLLQRVLKRDRTRLREHDEVWAAVGAALVQLERHADAVKWLSDWRSRPEVAPWMLSSLAIALHARKRETVALEVSRAALELTPDRSTPHHQLWLAFEEALAERTESASSLFAEAGSGPDEPRFKALRALVVAILSVESTPVAQRRKIFQNERSEAPPSRDPRRALLRKSQALDHPRAQANGPVVARKIQSFLDRRDRPSGRPKPPPGASALSSSPFLIGWIVLLGILGLCLKTCSSDPTRPEIPPAAPTLELKPPVPLGSDDAPADGRARSRPAAARG